MSSPDPVETVRTHSEATYYQELVKIEQAITDDKDMEIKYLRLQIKQWEDNRKSLLRRLGPEKPNDKTKDKKELQKEYDNVVTRLKCSYYHQRAEQREKSHMDIVIALAQHIDEKRAQCEDVIEGLDASHVRNLHRLLEDFGNPEPADFEEGLIDDETWDRIKQMRRHRWLMIEPWQGNEHDVICKEGHGASDPHIVILLQAVRVHQDIGIATFMCKIS